MEGSNAKLSFFERLVSSNNPNPGKFEDIGAEARKVFQIDSFEGIKAEYQRGLSNSFGVSHTIHLQPNAETPGQYEFGANYSAGKHLLLSRTLTSGDVLAQYVCSVTPNLTVRAQSQITGAPHQSNAVVNIDYKGTDWYGTAKIGSFAQWGISYLQAVSKNLALGVDFTYLARPPFKQPPMCVSTAAVRYANDDVAMVAQYTSNHRLQTSYIRRIKDYATFAAEFNLDMDSLESVCSMGYEYTSASGSLKTNITTDKRITTLLEKPLSELSAISVSAELDHKQGTCKYGIGMQFLQ